MVSRDGTPLTEAQREIMELFWDLGEATVSEIHERVARRRDVARNTIQTLIVRLEEKGWLRHVENGRTFIYSPAKPKTKSLGARISHIVDRLFGGSPEQLVNALLEHRGLSDSELENIRAMIDQAESNCMSGDKRTDRDCGGKPTIPKKTQPNKAMPKKGPKR